MGLLMVVVAIPQGATTEDDQEPVVVDTRTAASVVGTYRAAVTDRQVDHWLEFSGTTERDRAVAMEDMLLTMTLAQEARRLGLDRDPAVVVELEHARFRLLKPLLRQAVQAERVFSPEEIEAKYQEIKGTYTLPRRVRLRNIFKRYPPDADQAAKHEVRRSVEAIRARALAGESFAQLAERESDSQTRLQGGLLGNVRPGTLRVEVDRVAMAMEAGEISEILEAEDGLTILYCEKILDAVRRSPDELREIAAGLLERRFFTVRWQVLDDELEQRAQFTTEWQALESGADGALDLDAVLIRFGTGTLSVGLVQELLPKRHQGGLRDMPRERITALVKAFLSKKMSVREAYARGLHEGTSFEGRWHWRREAILSTKALALLIQERLPPVTREEKKRHYEEFAADFKRPAHYRLTLLALETRGRDLRDVYDFGARLRGKIVGGEVTLAEAAREHSVHGSMDRDGDSGWVPRPAVPKRYGIDFLREMLRLEPGELSKWVLSNNRLWLFRLEAVEAARPMSFEEAEHRVEQRVGRNRVADLERQISDEWLHKLRIRRP